MEKKINSTAGFTLSELLVAMLILSMIALCIGGGVTVAYNSYNTISKKSEAQLLLSTSILAITEELRNATNINEDGTEISFFNSSRGYQMTLRNTNSSGKKDNIYVAAIAGTTAIEVPLINSKMSSESLYPQVENLVYDSGKNLFSCNITIFNENIPIINQEIIVHPMNES